MRRVASGVGPILALAHQPLEQSGQAAALKVAKELARRRSGGDAKQLSERGLRATSGARSPQILGEKGGGLSSCNTGPAAYKSPC